MNATNKLLDKWYAVCKPATAMEAGKRLGVSGQSIANYRSGVSQAAPSVVATMARDIGESEAYWLALVESERARGAQDRKAWATVARTLSTAAAVLLFLGGIALPVKAEPRAAYTLCELLEMG